MTHTTWLTQTIGALTQGTVRVAKTGRTVEAITAHLMAVIETGTACTSNHTGEEVTVIETACTQVTDVLEGHLGTASIQMIDTKVSKEETLVQQVVTDVTQALSKVKIAQTDDNRMIGTIIARRKSKRGKDLSVKMEDKIVNSIMQRD